MDALSVIPLHDNVVITDKYGKVYSVDEINFEEDWVKHGHLAEVLCTFRTDTVVAITGRAAGDSDYDDPVGDCLTTDYTAIDAIAEGGAEYTGFTYMGSPMNDGDIFMTYDVGGVKTLRSYDQSGGAWTTLVVSDNYTCYVDAEDLYYFYHNADNDWYGPRITNLTDVLVQGLTFPGTTVEVWLKDASGNEWLEAVGSAAQFEGAGIAITRGDAEEIQVRASSGKCSQFATSVWVLFDGEGIGYMIVEGDNQVA